MSFLQFRDDALRQRDPPRRVYARVDHAMRTPDAGHSPFRGDDVVLLDSVDADWFDEARGGLATKLADAETVEQAERNVSVLAVRRRDLEALLGDGWSGRWLALTLAARREPIVLHYLNLFAAPVEQSLEQALPVERDLERDLADKTNMDDVDDATHDDLIRLVGSLPEPDAVAVYDVGQGNCAAAIAGNTPILYFDFGGGVLANRSTFPSALRQFCFSRNPPIVLSHWDWDHWSSANRDPRALRMRWIVPRQGVTGLGPVHRTFLARLLRVGDVRVWPITLPSAQQGAYELLRCEGPPSSRNNSGLALVIQRNGVRAGRMLLPGDCAYEHIPEAAGHRFTSLVASHHGGRAGSTALPRHDSGAAGRLVYSCGRNNTYGHPLAAMRGKHIDAGWSPALETSARCPCRGPSPKSTAPIFGHIHLYWNQSDPDAHPACGGAMCDLTCHQR